MWLEVQLSVACSKWNLYDAVHGEKAYVIGNIMENPELLRGYKQEQSKT